MYILTVPLQFLCTDILICKWALLWLHYPFAYDMNTYGVLFYAGVLEEARFFGIERLAELLEGVIKVKKAKKWTRDLRNVEVNTSDGSFVLL